MCVPVSRSAYQDRPSADDIIKGTESLQFSPTFLVMLAMRHHLISPRHRCASLKDKIGGIFNGLCGVTMALEAVLGACNDFLQKRMLACEATLERLIGYIKKNLFFVGVALLAVIACGGVFGALYLHFFKGIDIPKITVVNNETASYWGQLGDFAGGFLNPLLSFLALMAVLKTMALQRAEMKTAQLEAKTATQEQRQQTAVYSRQMFESTLFGMLDVHAKILGDIKFSGGVGPDHEGRDAIDVIVRSFKETGIYRRGNLNPDELSDEYLLEEIEKFCRSKVSSIGHYFRNLYWIMKMIDTNKDILIDTASTGTFGTTKSKFFADYRRKRNYTNIVRAQLSESEMALLQLNCLAPHGADLKYYVEKYSLLKPLGRSYFGGLAERISNNYNEMAFVGLETINTDALMKMTNARLFRDLSAVVSKI